MRSTEELTRVQRVALAHDEATVRAARSLGAFELALGVTLGRLFRGDRLLQIGCSRESDYARERLGVSPSLMFSWVALARGLESRPLLRLAVTAGAVSSRKALAVMPLAVGDDEPAWTEAAMRLTLREIASAVRAAGKEPLERFECEAIVFPMTAEQQARLDRGLAFAKESIGPEARRWQCLEAMSEEWLSDHGDWEGKGASGKGDDHGPPAPLRGKILMKQLAAAGEALDVIAEIGKEPLEENALGLNARALRLVAARRRYDLVFGALAEKARDGRVHAILGYRSFAEYCEERLGVSAGTVRQRIWLERRMREMPTLREAVSSGRLAYSKAVLVAKHATPADVDERVERAASTTCQQTERETEAEEDRKNRGAGVRKLWAPSEAARTVRDAVGSAQAWSLKERGVAIGCGEALALIADHFAEVAMAHRPRGKRLDRLRHEVLSARRGSAPCRGARGRPCTSTTSCSARAAGRTRRRTRSACACPTTSTGSTSATSKSGAAPASGSIGNSGPGKPCRWRSGSPSATTTFGGRGAPRTASTELASSPSAKPCSWATSWRRRSPRPLGIRDRSPYSLRIIFTMSRGVPSGSTP